MSGEHDVIPVHASEEVKEHGSYVGVPGNLVFRKTRPFSGEAGNCQSEALGLDSLVNLPV